jgi:hypothetical protein
MNRILFFILFFILLIGCKANKIETDVINTMKASDSSFTRNNKLLERPRFITFMGIDSIARSDNSISDTLIDSISVRRLTFSAKYLSCFRVKGNIKFRLYQPLKYSHPSEYEEIIAIRTGHGFLVDTTVYHFSGRNSIDSNNFLDSNDVNVYASIYSLFSRNKHKGNIVIIDSVVDRIN